MRQYEHVRISGRILIIAVTASCGRPGSTTPSNRGVEAPPPPRVRPCGLDATLPQLDDLAWEATRRRETTIGTCRIGQAPNYERFQLHDGSALVAEMIYTCGLVAYVPGATYADARIGASGEQIVARWPSKPVRCAGAIALPEELAGKVSSCEVGPPEELPTQYLVRAAPPGDVIEGAAARSLLATHDVVAIVLYASARCR